jgi:nitrite reductase/ring-hydroxylating ferredoxin subunit
VSESSGSPDGGRSWVDVGPTSNLAKRPLTSVTVDNLKVAITHVGDAFGALSGVCNHAGGRWHDASSARRVECASSASRRRTWTYRTRA